MRPLLFFVLFIISTSRTNAQVGFGPELGAGMSSMHFQPAAGFTAASTSSIFSWRAGGMIDFGLNKKIYLQSGLFLSQKGQNRDFSYYTNDSLNEAAQQKLTIYYVDLPVNIVYKTGFQGKGRFFMGIGANPSYIIGGTNKLQSQGSSNGVPFNRNFNLSIVPGNPVAMFDIGLNLTAGYELATGLFFRAYYTTGVTDIGLGTEVDKNRVWGVGAGYIFGKGRNINKETDDLIDKTPE